MEDKKQKIIEPKCNVCGATANEQGWDIGMKADEVLREEGRKEERERIAKGIKNMKILITPKMSNDYRRGYSNALKDTLQELL